LPNADQIGQQRGVRGRAGDRIAQLVIVALPEVELEERAALEAAARGARGFGSSG
jgi:dUTPase